MILQKRVILVAFLRSVISI